VSTAKLFKNGRSQAVRLPREYRFKGDEVSIRREGDKVILEPLGQHAWPDGYWDTWGKATRDLSVVDSLPAGGTAVDLEDR